MIGFGLVLATTAIMVVPKLGKINWTSLALIVLNTKDGKTLEIVIEDIKADGLVELFTKHPQHC